jgi:hypothetical protein
VQFFTTDDVTDFNEHGGIFFGRTVDAQHLHI